MGYLERARELFRAACGIASAAAVVTASASDALVPLAAYNVDPAQVSVSGMASGGSMAIHLGVAYSSRIMGVAAFAAPPYDCLREGNVSGNLCAGVQVPNIEPLVANMHAWSGTKIDPVANLQRQRVYLFSGARDNQISAPVVGQSAQLYAGFVPERNLRYEDTIEAGHTFPTDFDNPWQHSCTGQLAYVGNCNFDGAYQSLHWIYGDLKPRTDESGVRAFGLITIDQSEFISRDLGMDDTAFLYVPERCAAGALCRLHVFLHACGRSYFSIGYPYFALYSGHTRWAETNDIVLLFPQTYPDDVGNPKGCWDTEGRYDSEFDQKGGAQTSAIMKMVTRITSGRATEYRHAEWNHYFVATGVDEIARLDAGVFKGWSRTDESFGVFPLNTPGTSNTCRFISTTFASRSSHFYATTARECEIVKGNPNWSFEGEVFAVALPDDAGVCAPGLQALYRLYNNGEGGAPNHRYTRSVATRDEMSASGWIPEAVAGCVPD